MLRVTPDRTASDIDAWAFDDSGGAPLVFHDVSFWEPLVNGLWVWTDEVTSPPRRLTLVERSSASGITDLYVSVFQGTPSSTGRLMHEDVDVAALIDSARSEGLATWAAYGAPDWPTLGCAPTSFLVQRMQEVVDYNAANPTVPFAGVMLDVEPPEPLSQADYQALLDTYVCVRRVLPGDVRLGAALRFFWDDPVEFPSGSGDVRPVHEHFLELGLDVLVIMGYRDTAGTPCPDNGLICVDEVEVTAATAGGHDGLVLVGLETLDCAPACGEEFVTFFEEGQVSLNLEVAAVLDHFACSIGFGGFALHAYGESYLSGVTDWPEVNPEFPTTR